MVGVAGGGGGGAIGRGAGRCGPLISAHHHVRPINCLLKGYRGEPLLREAPLEEGDAGRHVG